MKKLYIFLLAIVLGGCVTTEQADKRISAWDDVQLTDLFNAWGLPSKEQEIAGRKFYVWNAKNNSSVPAIGISVGSFGGSGGISISTLLGGSSGEDFCSRVVEVDAEENIKTIQWTGDPKLCLELTPERQP